MIGSQRGFTLIELMVTMAVLVILITIGVPSFNDLVQNQRVKTAVSELHSSLIFARSEAIKRNAEVTITRNGASWSNGWNVQTSDSTISPLPLPHPRTSFVIAGTDASTRRRQTCPRRASSSVSQTIATSSPVVLPSIPAAAPM
jgi:prepilin-type N-terminal cleavage/methylation domain-containing protein